MTKRNSLEVVSPAHRRDPFVRRGASATHPLPCRPSAPRATWIGLLLADVAAFAFCAWLFVSAPDSAAALWIAGGVWFLARAIAGLYLPVLLGPPEELRWSTITTIGGAVTHVAFAVALDGLAVQWAGIATLWGMLLVLPWGMRQLAKGMLSGSRLYGSPVVVIGSSDSATALIDELRRNPNQALHPVAVFADGRREAAVRGVPVLGDLASVVDFDFGYDVDHALVALGYDEAMRRGDWAERLGARFAHVHFTPEFVGLANLWVRAHAIGPLVTFEFQADRLRPFTLLFKRAFDLTLGFVLLVVTLPLIIVCALLVKLVSPGPAFFAQVREGHRGQLIRVWKIRTMVPDAEARLEAHLEQSSAARREWMERVKLGADPRVIPGLGRFLRRWSLDELPQLCNVVTGSMSLVGPRPFPGYHLDRFNTRFRGFRRNVPPGVTGLWQVTYRTDSDLSHQEAADSFYIHNWSIWLDLWILVRTVGVVLAGTGS